MPTQLRTADGDLVTVLQVPDEHIGAGVIVWMGRAFVRRGVALYHEVSVYQARAEGRPISER